MSGRAAMAGALLVLPIVAGALTGTSRPAPGASRPAAGVSRLLAGASRPAMAASAAEATKAGGTAPLGPTPRGGPPAWWEKLDPARPPALARQGNGQAGGPRPPGLAAPPFRERILASIVGIRATLSTPRLSFRGKRRVEVEAVPLGGTGSGIVVDPDGLILTCAHLFDEASGVRVLLADDRETQGKVVVIDRASDLALVRVEVKPLPSLDLQSQPSLRQGGRVYLASRPGGVAIRFEAGQLAAPGTYHLGHSQLEFFRRFVGGIEPGDSGGALVDEEGRFIGLLSVGHPEGGMGYAIAREFVFVALARLREGMPVVWPWLGIGVETPTDPPGVLAWTVAPGSPAQAAGVRPGDRIVSLDGKPVEHFLPAMMSVVSRPVGARFKLGILRSGTDRKSASERRGSGGTDPGEAAAPAPAADGRDRDPMPPAPTPETVAVISAIRPIEPVLPPLDLFERLTGIRLAMGPATPLEPAGLKVEAFTASAPEGKRPCAIGSRLASVVPGAGLVHALEEGRGGWEVRINTVADLGAALRASFDGPRMAAVLTWSTQGKQETMLLSGEAKQYPLL